MTMPDDDMLNEAALDDLFRAARAEAPMPSADLLARVMADAEAEIAAQPAPLPVRQAAPRKSHLRSLLEGLGGWPAVAGMITASVVGLSMGFVSPDQVNSLSGGLLLQSDMSTTSSYDLEDMLPGFGALDDLGMEG
ncbi:MAG: dihydroorotate dehydrogenase [Maritimibacter sp.]|jgi:hypothetical protein